MDEAGVSERGTDAQGVWHLFDRCGCQHKSPERIRAACLHAAMTVSQAHGVDVRALYVEGRGRARIARSRQIAIYLAHTILSVGYRDLADHFGRDRSTIAHACAVIEDNRDDPDFDIRVAELEVRLLSVSVRAETEVHQ